MPDKFTATWVSHSSISEFLRCPRAYYLKNIYRDPQTKHKVQLVSPPLSLGVAVHEVLEGLSTLPTENRFQEPLVKTFDRVWKKYSGKRGGFASADMEDKYRQRGEAMLRRVQENPGPLTKLAVKIKEDLPYYWLDEKDNIILCGKIDWLEYLPEEDGVNIIDFKTSKKEEDENSLQLPIYHLLVHNCQKRKVVSASYWYLDFSDSLTPKELPNLEEAHAQVLKIAREIKTARSLERFKCPHGEEGCYSCKSMERVVRGEAEFVGVNDYGQDVYTLLSPEVEEEESYLI